MEWDMTLKAEEDIKRYTSGENKGQPIFDGEGDEISNGFRITANASDALEHCNPHRNEEIANQPV
jgi:hypothetical protein